MSRLEDHLDEGLSVGDLIDILMTKDRSARVVFSYDYGDHWHTNVAEVIATVGEGTIAWSAYHRRPKVVEEEDTSDNTEDQTKTVIILQSN